MFPDAPLRLAGGDHRWLQDSIDDCVDTRRCDGDRSPPRRIAVRWMRWASESGEYRARGARQFDGALGVLPCTSGSGDGNATAPVAPTAAETGGKHHRRNACDTETNPSAVIRRARRRRQARADARERIAAAKLSELAAEARAAPDATTLERLIVKSLTRYYHSIDNEARRTLAAAEPPLTGTVWDAVIAATAEHACTTWRRRAGVDPGCPRALPDGRERATRPHLPDRTHRVEFATLRNRKRTDRPLETQRQAGAGQARSREAAASPDRTAELGSRACTPSWRDRVERRRGRCGTARPSW